jgi:hypothetical protein
MSRSSSREHTPIASDVNTPALATKLAAPTWLPEHDARLGTPAGASSRRANFAP